MHPEVTNVGLLTLLYAGTPSLYSSKYSSLYGTVKKLEQWRKSAGNILYIKNGTSEALRDGVVVNLENVKRVSDHVPKHLKPLNNELLGYYLAGLIDGDGHFSKAQQLVITFSSPDAFLAYYLKGRLGYGNVRKVKDKNAYLLIVSNEKGMLNIIHLINGKLRTEHRFNQVVNNVLSHTKYADQNIHFTIDSSKNFDNHWLAGFSDASHTTFEIQLLTCKKQPLTPSSPGASGVKGWDGNKTSVPKALLETNLVVWGKNLPSSVGLGRFTKQESNMIRIPAYEQSVITGLMLSDGWLTFGSKTSKSARLGFKQSLSHSGYFWFVFTLLSHYCSSIPNLITSTRKGTKTYAFQILTRSLPCFNEFYSLYYPNGIKTIPADIFNLLTPVALAHWESGDGAKNRHGLTISTESFYVNDTVRLLNVLTVKYRLDCSIRKHSIGYNIYIKEKSMPILRTLIEPHMHSSMLYKLRIDPDLKESNRVNASKDILRKKISQLANHYVSSQEKVVDKSNSELRVEIKLNFKIVESGEIRGENKDSVLLLIKEFLGGYISYNKENNEYTYSSSSYGSARKVIKYFDLYHLQSRKHIRFLRWRKSYIHASKGNYLGIHKYYKVLGS